MKSSLNKLRILIGVCALGILLQACTPTQKIHGNIVDEKRLAQLELDTTTQRDALRILGTPTTTSTVGSQLWYYIGQKTSQRGIYKAEVDERRVVALEFNEEGILNNIATLTEKDGQDVQVSLRETPSSGRSFTVMQQLLGNLGRFNKSAFE